MLNHLERLVRDGATLDLSPSLPAPERAARIREELPAAGAEALRPVRDRLGPSYSYEEIRIVRASARARAGRTHRRRPTAAADSLRARISAAPESGIAHDSFTSTAFSAILPP